MKEFICETCERSFKRAWSEGNKAPEPRYCSHKCHYKGLKNPRRKIRRLDADYHPKDTGCALAESCLNCPFDGCVEDLSGSERQDFIKERAIL